MVSTAKRALIAVTILAGCGFCATSAADAQPLPTGGTPVTGGIGITQPNASSLLITQSTATGIINWSTFSIAQAHQVQFNNGNGATLNRVTTNVPSSIEGLLSATGSVYLINPSGVVVGPTGIIKTGGSFVASTLDVKNEQFLAGGPLTFSGGSQASVVNLGKVTSAKGDVVLIARTVENAGSLNAPNGTVAMASGTEVVLNDQSTANGKVSVRLGDGDGKVVNRGAIRAADVELRANGGNIYALAGNTNGVIKATGVANKGGRIFLTAEGGEVVVTQKVVARNVDQTRRSAKQNGTTQVASGGSVYIRGDKVTIASTIDANGRNGAGGKIVVTGRDLSLASGALLTANGTTGGTILFGGDRQGGAIAANNFSSDPVENAKTVRIASGAAISANGSAGNGGNIVVWSDGTTIVDGSITAIGTRGGFIETSGHTVLTNGATINAGPGGNWLLDPDDLLINASLASTIMASLNAGTNVKQETTASGTGGVGNITVAANITWSSSATLTLSAFRNIIINSNVTISNTGAGNLILRANNSGNTGTGGGTVVLQAGQLPERVNWSGSTGFVSIYYNPERYTIPTNFVTGNGRVAVSDPSRFTAYMLVNSVADLNNIASNPKGTYALGRDIDLTSFRGFSGTLSFNGILDGNGGLGVMSTLSNLSLTGRASNVGLFPEIGSTGIVRNLVLDNVTVSAGANGIAIGAIAGINNGLISNVTVTSGSVTGGSFQGISAGGLVGQNNGTITQSFSAVGVTVANGAAGALWNYAGGIAGQNRAGATIGNSTATGIITGGDDSFTGGLVGQNDGTISNSIALGVIVTAAGGATDPKAGASFGGLVGFNSSSGLITGSEAIAEVDVGNFGNFGGGLVGQNQGRIEHSTAVATVAGSGAGSSRYSIIGGLVGQNGGLDQNGNPVAGTIFASAAFVAISGGDFTSAGGLVGQNNSGSTIDQSVAAGLVIVGSNSAAGGFAGRNEGLITNAIVATAVEAAAGSTNSLFGGLAGENASGGAIRSSVVVASVTGGTQSETGGLAGHNTGEISGSSVVLGFVSAGANSVLGGVAGVNEGQITGAFTGLPTFNGTVTASNNSVAGGIAGANAGLISLVASFGQVTATGSNNALGGIAGANFARIDQAFSAMDVSAGADNFLGGLAGINATVTGHPTASITHSYATGNVTGSGNATAGGLVGLNGAVIEQAYATGQVTGGTTGGLVAVNSVPSTLPVSPSRPVSLVPGNGTVTNSYWNTQTSGQSTSAAGTGLTTAQLAGGLPVGFDPTIWSTSPGSYPFLSGQPSSGPIVPPIPPGPPPPEPPLPPSPPGPQPIPNPVPDPFSVFVPFVQPPILLASITTTGPPSFGSTDVTPPPPFQENTSGQGSGGPGGQGSGQGGQGGGPGGPGAPSSLGPLGPGPVPGPGIGRTPSEQLLSGVPPLNETNFIVNQALLQFSNAVRPAEIDELIRELGVSVLSTTPLGLNDRTLYQLELPDGVDLRDLILRAEAKRIVASAGAIYNYRTQQNAPAAPEPAAAGTEPAAAGTEPASDLAARTTLPAGDPAQYMIEKLHLSLAHQRVRGIGVTVAVIDSEVDVQHPDLRGVVVDQFDATGGPRKPHAHGTGMVGAMASRTRLLGVSPGVRVLAVKAFDETSTSAESTSLQIIKGLEWAIAKNPRIINMSFAGPRDLMMERILEAASEKNILLIAAAGNAGPKSPPLFPAAEPNVLAVSATDASDRPFTGANRGKYIALAAPGVDVLVPAPDSAYQLTTGTSVAAAITSGVAALLIESKPSLTPTEVRNILMRTAKTLSVNPKDNQTGAGLVDPVKALSVVAPVPTSNLGPRP